MTRVKICGITNLPDALAAVRFGADALGFLVGALHPTTSRFLRAEDAAEIVGGLPPFCSPVLVTHLADLESIVAAAVTTRVTTIQLHGESTPETARRIRAELPWVKLYKVLHVTAATTPAEAEPHLGTVDAFVLDTANTATGQVGGTGRTHDWKVSRAWVEALPVPVILAGGLHPENVAEAIRTVRPFGVDVNSGVSRPDGSKDPDRLAAFLRSAKS